MRGLPSSASHRRVRARSGRTRPRLLATAPGGSPMNPRFASIGCVLLLAGCAATAPAPSPTAPPTAAVTSAATAAPTADLSPTRPPSVTPSPSPIAWPAGITAHPAGSAGNDIGVLSYLPPGYDDDDADRPLLVFLHGAGEYGDGSEAHPQQVLRNGIPAMIAARKWPTGLPFVVLMPQYSSAEANGPCALADELESVIAWADETYRIHPTRVYQTRISCGAIGVLDYLAASSERRVAATVPISSAPYENAYPGARVRGGCAIPSTPPWFFHGALDDIVPVHYVKD